MPSLGPGYLASVLRQAGLKVAVLDGLRQRLSPFDFANHISKTLPDVIGFQLYSYDLNGVRDLLCAVRSVLPEAVTLAGGPHPSGDPEGTLRLLTDLDYAFQGEAETGPPLLLSRLDGANLPFNTIPGLGTTRRRDKKPRGNGL